jgi:hypothetical protein
MEKDNEQRLKYARKTFQLSGFFPRPEMTTTDRSESQDVAIFLSTPCGITAYRL